MFRIINSGVMSAGLITKRFRRLEDGRIQEDIIPPKQGASWTPNRRCAANEVEILLMGDEVYASPQTTRKP